MKKKLILIGLSCVMLILSLAACSSAEPAADKGSVENASEALTTASENPAEEKGPRLSGEADLSTQLLLGTFQLEGTDLAVNADQASELLPLWKAVRSLSNSDTASSVEMDALFNQIQDAMTSEQLNQISSAVSGPESMQELMDELGLDIAMGGRGNVDDNASGENMRPGGGMGGPGQGVPGSGPGGEGFSDEQRALMESMSDEERATAIAERGGGMNPMNTMLLDPLIELLTERAAQ